MMATLLMWQTLSSTGSCGGLPDCGIAGLRDCGIFVPLFHWLQDCRILVPLFLWAVDL